MAKAKSFFVNEDSPEDVLSRQRDISRILRTRQAVVQDIPAELIQANPFQARRTFDQIDELADAIRVQGFTSRLRVRPDMQKQGYYQLVYGERRLLAAKKASLVLIPCEISEHTDEEMIEIGLTENLQRVDLNPVEEARAFRQFLDMRGPDGKSIYSYRKLEERIGKTKGYIQNRLELLNKPEDVQALVEARPDTISAAKLISKLPTSEERAPLIEKLISGESTYKDVLERVRSFSNEPETKDEVYSREYSLVDTEVPEAAREKRILRNYKKDFEAIEMITLRWYNASSSMEPEAERFVQEAINTLRGRLDVIESAFNKTKK